jgi:hypothetical protein
MGPFRKKYEVSEIDFDRREGKHTIVVKVRKHFDQKMQTHPELTDAELKEVKQYVENIGKWEHYRELHAELLQDTAERFDTKEILADKAYLSKKNLEEAADLGVEPYIPFKLNNKAAGNGMTWKRMYHYFQLQREEFLRHYHKRSNAETTVHMIKAKFGDHVRSKKWHAQVNEVLCKLIAHNICVVVQEMHERGIEPEFFSV